MSLLLSCELISKSYGSQTLFTDISMGIFHGDKIGIVGPNGSGKSTLMKIFAGYETPDRGNISCKRSLRVGYVPQDSLFPNVSIQEVLMNALCNEHAMDEHDKYTQINITLGKFGFDNPCQIANQLSGGWKKRLSIAQEVIKKPDILLFDEPTNHLDLEGILWLEKFLQREPFAYLVVSHDRYFLENVATKMMELNKSYPKGMFLVDGSYSAFLEKKEEFLKNQAEQERVLSNKVKNEIDWLRRSPKARTTKAQSRVQEAHRLIDELSDVKSRNKQAKTSIDFAASDRQTRKLLVATNLAKSVGKHQLFSALNFTLSPGTRLGIVGPNGSGKTTLLKLLAGEAAPDKGTLKLADGIRIVYFDQHRAQLPQDITLKRALAPENDIVNYRGQSIHVNGWCKRFLFTPDRLELPLSYFSGGEKARISLARLMQEPADILMLDEPTNDLDIPTLEILEESLMDFPGAIVLITHDRYLLDKISNVIIGLGSGNEATLFADYAQWEASQQEQKAIAKVGNEEKRILSQAKTKKLSYKELQEWEQMEGKIFGLESEIEEIQNQIIAANIASNPTKLQETCDQLHRKKESLEALYHRWEELEQKKSL